MANIQQTSITAYNEEVRSGKIPSQRKRIESIIKFYGPLTRREIREHCRYGAKFMQGVGFLPDIPMSSVCGRVRALLDGNIIHISDHKEDPVTGKRVQVLAYGPKPKINDGQYEMGL